MSNPIRMVPEIGMLGFSRGMGTCKWATPWCRENCYFKKFYRMGWATDERDKKDNGFWRSASSEEFVTAVKIAADFEPVPRFRFSVKGEIWLKKDDVEKVMLIMRQMPETLFWIPTRAWHSGEMADLIERHIFSLRNARVLASTDPDTTPDEWMWLRYRRWPIVFSGDNDDPRQLMLAPGGAREKVTLGMHRCEKTWDQRSGRCATCGEGCFSPEQVEVHLKRHR
jgi:hypothetical protein